VPWRKWAVKKGFAKAKKTDSQMPEKPIHTRTEDTYLTIIGALLELVINSPDKKIKHPDDFPDRESLVKFLKDYKMDGLSGSNLRKKFKEAEQAFESKM